MAAVMSDLCRPLLRPRHLYHRQRPQVVQAVHAMCPLSLSLGKTLPRVLMQSK